MIWNVPKIWEGGEAWILGGGPSVPRQFGIPEKVIQQVVDGSAPPSIYSDYMQGIHDKHVIGINVAYLIGGWVDIVFFGDNGFFLAHQKGLAEFPGLKVSCYPHLNTLPWVKFLARDNAKPKGITGNPKMVSWNGNSGAAAISLAAHLGVKRIILLGFDMKLSADNSQHWHDLYGRKEAINNPKTKKRLHLPFDRHLLGFPEIAKDAKLMGIEIINASPESAIDCFPKMTVKELLK